MKEAGEDSEEEVSLAASHPQPTTFRDPSRHRDGVGVLISCKATPAEPSWGLRTFPWGPAEMLLQLTWLLALLTLHTLGVSRFCHPSIPLPSSQNPTHHLRPSSKVTFFMKLPCYFQG